MCMLRVHIQVICDREGVLHSDDIWPLATSDLQQASPPLAADKVRDIDDLSVE